jgi:serine/threonine-protein kinase
MGALPELDRRPLRFGVFELDPVSGELRKHGVRVRLQDQPLKLLLCLIEMPGEIRTREDLIRKIWPEGTFVDYERGLNVTITRLRQVLGDSADSPRYIETVGRKGYRFIAPVERPSALESTQTPPDSEVAVQHPPEAARTNQFSRLLLYAAIISVSLAITAALGWWRASRPETLPLLRLNIDLGPEVTTAGYGAGSLLAISRDGTRLAMSVSSPDGKIRLATRRLDQSQLTFLAGTEGAGTEGAASPFFSPDGQWIAFFSQGKLKKIAAEGGQPVTLCDADTHAAGRASMFFPTGSWGDDGKIVAALNVAVGLSRIPATGGTPMLLKFKKERGEICRWPQILPGNETVLFTASRGDYEGGSIDVFSFKTGERKTIQQGGILGKYLPTGHLVYIRQNVLFAAPFDLKTLNMKGAPQPILEDMGGRFEGWNYDFSQNGSLVYVSQPRDTRTEIFWLDRAGKVSALQDAPGFYNTPRFSPDGTRLAFSMSGRSSQGIWVQNIWVENLDLGTASPLTSLPGVNDSPIWTADGRSIVFRSVNQPNPGIYSVRADGGGETRRLADLSTGIFPSSISLNGNRLAIWDFSTGGHIWTTPVEIKPEGLRLGRAESFLETTVDPPLVARTAAAFSPDGRWLAYSSLESGHIELYVRPFPGPGGKWRISRAGGTHPIWSRNGRELLYIDYRSRKLMVVSYKALGGSFVPGEPAVWSDKPVLDLGELYSYDIAPDGKHVAVVLYTDGTAEQKPATSFTFVLNFFDELRRRVPSAAN